MERYTAKLTNNPQVVGIFEGNPTPKLLEFRVNITPLDRQWTVHVNATLHHNFASKKASQSCAVRVAVFVQIVSGNASMGGVVADAKDTIKMFAFSDHAGILRAMAEYSLKR